MAALIAHAAPFVVAFAGTPDGEAHEDRRDRAMWLKQNKAALAQVCRALVTVDADPARRAEAIEQGRMATKAFGIAHEAVASLDDASRAGAPPGAGAGLGPGHARRGRAPAGWRRLPGLPRSVPAPGPGRRAAT